MVPLVVASALLVVAAAWELAGSKGEAGVSRLRRRLDLSGRSGTGAILERVLGRGGEQLRDAGLDERISRSAVAVAKLLSAALAMPLATAAAPVAPGRLGPLVVIGVPVAAFLAPDLLLDRAARRRRLAISSALPDALDLMATGAAAGRGVGKLLDEAMHTSRGPLREELARAVAAIECGSSKEQVLLSLAERGHGSSLAGLASSLERSRRHGSPLSRTLHEQAGSLRGDQRREITERGARAAPMMQLVVALLLVPSVLLTVAAAIVANSGSLLPSF